MNADLALLVALVALTLRTQLLRPTAVLVSKGRNSNRRSLLCFQVCQDARREVAVAAVQVADAIEEEVLRRKIRCDSVACSDNNHDLQSVCCCMVLTGAIWVRRAYLLCTASCMHVLSLLLLLSILSAVAPRNHWSCCMSTLTPQ